MKLELTGLFFAILCLINVCTSISPNLKVKLEGVGEKNITSASTKELDLQPSNISNISVKLEVDAYMFKGVLLKLTVNTLIDKSHYSCVLKYNKPIKGSKEGKTNSITKPVSAGEIIIDDVSGAGVHFESSCIFKVDGLPTNPYTVSDSLTVDIASQVISKEFKYDGEKEIKVDIKYDFNMSDPCFYGIFVNDTSKLDVHKSTCSVPPIKYAIENYDADNPPVNLPPVSLHATCSCTNTTLILDEPIVGDYEVFVLHGDGDFVTSSKGTDISSLME